eukprot:GHVU01028315.1.p1 GENE.GHVU01028315.1~~GHVU01028315.1.p1  ORF type:complete len:403 (+),score=70.78 GHVU01028315.1:1086-2294(+)
MPQSQSVRTAAQRTGTSHVPAADARQPLPPPQQQPAAVPLDGDLMRRLKPIRVHKELTKPVTGIDWSVDGDLFVVSSDESVLYYLSLSSPNTPPKRTEGGQYAPSQPKVLRDHLCVVLVKQHDITSRSTSAAVRLWNVRDNKFNSSMKVLPTWPGWGNGLTVARTGAVCYVAAACEKKVMVFDFGKEHAKDADDSSSQANKQAQQSAGIQIPDVNLTRPVATFSPSGSFLAVTRDSKKVDYFNIHHLKESPFLSVNLSSYLTLDDEEVVSLSVAPGEDWLLVGSNYGRLFAVQTAKTNCEKMDYELTGGRTLLRESRLKELEKEYCFPAYTCDGKFVISGTPFNTIAIWNAETGTQEAELDCYPGEWVSTWVSAWASAWVSAWVGECVNECVNACVCAWERE